MSLAFATAHLRQHARVDSPQKQDLGEALAERYLRRPRGRSKGRRPVASCVLHLLVDTSTWLDLAKRRDGQKWIVAIRLLSLHGDLELLVPAVVLDEFERNRTGIEQSMTASVSERFRLLQRDLDAYGGADQQEAVDLVAGLAHQVPLIGAMTTRNFDDIADLLRAGRELEPTDVEHGRVVQRGLDKQVPFHRPRNSVADALLIELYATAAHSADLTLEPHAFVTSNSKDFSDPEGDNRAPHPDLAPLFADQGSRYGLGVEGLDAILGSHFGGEFHELVEESDFREDPRRLDEIQAAEQEFFDRIWYQRSMAQEWKREDAGDHGAVEDLRRIAGAGRRRVEERFKGAKNLGPYSDFEWGMLNGKLSALRWVLGSEWDFLDT